MTAPIRLEQRKNSDGIHLVVGVETSLAVPAVIFPHPPRHGAGWTATGRLRFQAGGGGSSSRPAACWALHHLSCLAPPTQPSQGRGAEETGRAGQQEGPKQYLG